MNEVKGRAYNPQVDVYNVKQAAMILGIHRDTLIYWEDNNLVPPPMRNPKNNYRAYSSKAIKEIASHRRMFDLDIDAQIAKLKSGELNAS